MRYSRFLLEKTSSCPVATYDLSVNLANRQKAIDNVGYGPANPMESSTKFWQKKAKMWKISVEEVKTMRCGNCAAFNISDEMRNCIEMGIEKMEPGHETGGPDQPMATIEKADLGYCQILHFKCAGDRTCDAWLTGGALDNKDLK